MDVNTINSVIDNIAEKLAVPSAQIVEALSKIGIKYTIITIMLLISIIPISLCWYSLIRASSKSEADLDDFCAYLFLILFVISLILIGALAYMTFESIFWVISPKAWALNYILSKF